MDFRVVLTEGSLFFLIVLLMIYYKKQHFNDARTKIYKYLLLSTLLFEVIQIGFIFTLKYISIDIVSYILWKLQWVCSIIWLGLIYFYTCTICNNKKYDKSINIFKENLFKKIISILVICSSLLIAILPKNDLVDYKNYEKLSFLPGYMKIIFPLICAFVFIIIVITIFKHKSKLKKNAFYALFFIVFDGIICLTLQVLFEKIAFIGLGFTSDVFFIYFLIENPDIKVIEEIHNAQGEIEKSSRTKTDFLSNMTYEIKVPMNLIMSLCDEITNMSVFNEKIVRDDISQIVASGNSLIEIINNILEISKIETDKIIAIERNYKVKDLLIDVINIAKSKIGTKKVKLLINIDQNISSILLGDYAKIYQSLVNVLTNAVKYTDVGRVMLTLTSTKSDEVEKLLFKVSDTGSGIKQEDQSKIFVKGSRLENAMEGEIEGSGLGLAITKKYVESMEGKIWFESQYRVGTTFYIEIPQKIIDSTPIGNLNSEPLKEEVKELLDCSKYTVLIVDDNTLNIKVAKRLLEKYKFNVESVMSGKDCIYKIKEGTQYDAIFMDHMMPEMDGIETLHILKKLDGYVLPPIIALTANAVAGMREMYLSEGFDEYISKPINTNELDRVINKFFKN